MSFIVTRVAYGDTASGSNTVLAVPSTLPVGSYLVALVGSPGGGSTVGLSDSKGNTWTQREYATNATSPAATVAIFTTADAGLATALLNTDTLTATSSAGSGCGDIMLLQVTVNIGTISYGTGSTGTGNSAAPAVASFTPGAGNLAISALVESSNILESGSTAGTGYTKLASKDTPSRPRAVVGEYGVPGGPTTTPFVMAVSQQYAIAAISLVQTVPPPASFLTEMANFVYGPSTSVTSRTVPVTAAVAAGAYITLAVNVPAGAGTNTTCTVTDTQSNTWTKRQNAVNGPANGQPFLITCAVTTPLTTSDTLTVTVNFGSTIWEVQGLAYAGVTSYDQGAANNGASGKVLTVGPTGAGAQPTQLLVAAFAGTGTGVTMTGLAPGFTAPAPLATTGTIRNLWMVWGFVNVAGTRTVSASMSDATNHAWAGVLVVLNSNAPVATHTAFAWIDGDWVACDKGLWIDGAWVFS